MFQRQSRTRLQLSSFPVIGSAEFGMHDTAYKIGGRFLEKYIGDTAKILELGSYNVNGTLRDFSREAWHYVGVDFEVGLGVDVCVAPGDGLPFANDTFDAVISTSVFEHDAAFWDTALEAMRVTKPDGFLYINAPSNGTFHRYSRDYWRFYPDSGEALVRWIQKAGIPCYLRESFVSAQGADKWNDFVAVLVKSERPDDRKYYLSDEFPSENVRRGMDVGVVREIATPEDQRSIDLLKSEIAELQSRLRISRGQLIQARARAAQALNASQDLSSALGPLHDGAVDHLSTKRCSGWALEIGHMDSPMEIVVRANGRIVAGGAATLFREDLFESGYGSGCFGFDLEFELSEVGEVRIDVGANGIGGSRQLASIMVLVPTKSAD